MKILPRRALIAAMTSIVVLLSFLISGYSRNPGWLPLAEDKTGTALPVEDPLVELYLQDASVAEAIEQLENRYGVKVELNAPIPGTVTCAFSRLRLSHVLETLVGRQEYRVERDGLHYRILARPPQNAPLEAKKTVDSPAVPDVPVLASKQPAPVETPRPDFIIRPDETPEPRKPAAPPDALASIQAAWQSGDRKGAFSLLEQHLSQKRNDARALTLLGQFHKAERRLRSALSCWNKAVILQAADPELASARDELEMLVKFIEDECKRYPAGPARRKLEVYLR